MPLIAAGHEIVHHHRLQVHVAHTLICLLPLFFKIYWRLTICFFPAMCFHYPIIYCILLTIRCFMYTTCVYTCVYVYK